MHKRIYLLGFMGSGKTTHGKTIARMMGYDFVDMDRWIEETTGMTVPKIFNTRGEPWFREQERRAINELSKREHVVIATGGGAPCHGDHMALMKQSGLTIYLKLSPEALLSRLKVSKNKRPLLEGKSEEEMRQTIKEMLLQREPFYNNADMIIDGLERVTERVVNAIQRQQQ
jgi:shikimate kinase